MIKKICSNPQALIGFIILSLFIFIALFGELIWPYDPNIDWANRYASISWEHPFGTDQLGRDLFRQLISGTSTVLQIAFFTGLFTTVIGVILGMVSGFLGGWVDKVIQGITNIFLSIPSFPVMLLLASLFTIEDPITFAIVLSLWNWTGLCRSVRAQVMSLRERDFIQICTVMKMSKGHIIFKELIPNLSSYILINFIIVVKSAITGAVGIMMLGLAAYDPTNWGSMLESARGLGLINPKVIPLLLVPLGAIVLFQMGAILLANGLDEILNPRLKVK